LVSDRQRAAREFKRPDFYWAYHDHDGVEPARQFVLECKRLTHASSGWVYTEQYVTAGIARFVSAEHGYGKASPSGAMIGYLQRMSADDALDEVNGHLGVVALPLVEAAGSSTLGITTLAHGLTRSFPDSPYRLRHFWRAD
jgi:hypothetical protein